MAKRRVEVFTAGCSVCQNGLALVQEIAGEHHEVIVHDMHKDEAAAEQASTYGIRTVPAVVVDGTLLGCCRNSGPTREQLAAAGLDRPAE